MTEFLQKNPLLLALTGVTALLTGLHDFVGSFGLAPFWADVVISALLAISAIYWLVGALRETKRSTRNVGLGGNPKNKLGFINRFRKVAGGSIVVLVILLVLFGWHAAVPATHLTDTQWQVCGTFVASCNGNGCLEFYDGRKRNITERCYPFDDDSGYKQLNAPNWWTYKPQSVQFRCEEKLSRRNFLGQEMFRSSCDAVLKLQ